MHHILGLGLALLTGVMSEYLPLLEISLTRDRVPNSSPQEISDLWLHNKSPHFLPQLVALGVTFIVVEVVILVKKVVPDLTE